MQNDDARTDFEKYLTEDTAGTYKKIPSTAREKVDQTQLNQYLASLHSDGYVIIPNVLPKQTLEHIKQSVAPFLEKTGRNYFEGTLTQRIYAVIRKTMSCNLLVENPLILALLDSVFEPDYLLSQLQVINLLPGEKAQPLHYDDALYKIPRPRKSLGAATIWAIDDFTTENGGTVIIPGSHKWGDGFPTDEQLARQVKCEMKAGSVVFFLGTLWHGGGANQSSANRLAVTAQYCEGYCRTQENYSLSIPPEIAAQCSERIQQLLGYSIYGPFMGMVDGKHPKRVLENVKQS